LDNFADRNGFGAPTNGEELSTRVKHNLRYYRANYLVILLVILCLATWFRTSLLWVVLFTSATAFGVISYPKLEIAGHIVGDVEKYAFTVFVLVVSIWWTETASTIYSFVFLTALIILAHSIFRRRSIKSQLSNFVDTSGVSKVKQKIQTEAKKLQNEVNKAID